MAGGVFAEGINKTKPSEKRISKRYSSAENAILLDF